MSDDKKDGNKIGDEINVHDYGSGLKTFSQIAERKPEGDAVAARRMKTQAEKRKAKRKVKEVAKISLNINSMMDIFSNILIYLIMNYATSPVAITLSDDLQLPISNTTLQPADSVPVYITTRGIMVNNEPTVRIENFKVPASAKEAGSDASYVIEPVVEALDKEREKQERIAEYNPNRPFKGEAAIIGHKDMPSRLLLEVMYSAGKAQFGNFRFAVVRSGK
ncbi:MAG: hypothetical protein Kow0090_04910 [Myxococcota bacterium]